MIMTLDQIVDWIVDQMMRFVLYLAHSFPAVDTLGATALSGGALSSDENDDTSTESDDDDDDTSTESDDDDDDTSTESDDDTSTESDDDTSTESDYDDDIDTENYCVVDGTEGTKSTEIPLDNKDESTL